VPVELMTFTDVDRPLHFIISPFDERSVSREELIQRYCTAGLFKSNNSDGESITEAYNRIRRRKEKRKVIIVLSDGCPASTADGDEVAHTRAVVRRIEEETPIEIYGIGIMSNSVDDFYRNHAVINSADKLESALLELVKAKVLE